MLPNALHFSIKNSDSLGGGNVIHRRELCLLWANTLKVPLSMALNHELSIGDSWFSTKKHPGAKRNMLGLNSQNKRKERTLSEEKNYPLCLFSPAPLTRPRWPSSGRQTNAQASNWPWCSGKCVQNKRELPHNHIHTSSQVAQPGRSEAC